MQGDSVQVVLQRENVQEDSSPHLLHAEELLPPPVNNGEDSFLKEPPPTK